MKRRTPKKVNCWCQMAWRRRGPRHELRHPVGPQHLHAHSWRVPPLALALPCCCPNSCPPQNPIVIPSPAAANWMAFGRNTRRRGRIHDTRFISFWVVVIAVTVAWPLPLASAASTPGLLVPWWFGLSPQVVLGEALAVVRAVFAGGWTP